MRRMLIMVASIGGVLALIPTSAASAAAPPIGNFDQVVIEGDGTVIAEGWAYDPDDEATPVDIHIYADEELVAAGPADGPRPDVADALDVDPDHGFSLTLPLTDGQYEVCAFAIDIASDNQGNPNLGCADVTVGDPPPADPPSTPPSAESPLLGWLDALAPLPGDSSFRVRGWTFDPAAIDRTVVVHVYVDDTLVSARSADGSRPDVGAALGGIGDDHGFVITIPFSIDGEHEVCVWAIAEPDGVNIQIGCAPLVGAPDPPAPPPPTPRPPGEVTITPGEPFEFEIVN